MNQWDYLNRRADELERVLNAGKDACVNSIDPQKPTLYEIQRQYAEDVKQLRQQFEESQRKQEIKDREQAKESQFNRRLAIASFAVSIFATLFTVITTLIR